MTTGETTPMDPQDAFAQLGRIVLGEQSLSGILEQVVHLARRVLPTTVEASITLVSDAKPETAAFTAPIALALDERQYETERGPCLDAATTGQRIRITEMAQETRWPQFTEAAADSGVHSSLSIPLPIQRQVTGALNFYGTVHDAFR